MTVPPSANEGSQGQNVDARRLTGTGREPGDIGYNRGRSWGSRIITHHFTFANVKFSGRRD